MFFLAAGLLLTVAATAVSGPRRVAVLRGLPVALRLTTKAQYRPEQEEPRSERHSMHEFEERRDEFVRALDKYRQAVLAVERVLRGRL